MLSMPERRLLVSCAFVIAASAVRSHGAWWEEVLAVVLMLALFAQTLYAFAAINKDAGDRREADRG